MWMRPSQKCTTPPTALSLNSRPARRRRWSPRAHGQWDLAEQLHQLSRQPSRQLMAAWTNTKMMARNGTILMANNTIAHGMAITMVVVHMAMDTHMAITPQTRLAAHVAAATLKPAHQPTRLPTRQPSTQPSRQLSTQPSTQPTIQLGTQPTHQPTTQPTTKLSTQPTTQLTNLAKQLNVKTTLRRMGLTGMTLMEKPTPANGIKIPRVPAMLMEVVLPMMATLQARPVVLVVEAPLAPTLAPVPQSHLLTLKEEEGGGGGGRRRRNRNRNLTMKSLNRWKKRTTCLFKSMPNSHQSRRQRLS